MQQVETITQNNTVSLNALVEYFFCKISLLGFLS